MTSVLTVSFCGTAKRRSFFVAVQVLGHLAGRGIVLGQHRVHAEDGRALQADVGRHAPAERHELLELGFDHRTVRRRHLLGALHSAHVARGVHLDHVRNEARSAGEVDQRRRPTRPRSCSDKQADHLPHRRAPRQARDVIVPGPPRRQVWIGALLSAEAAVA